MYSKILVPLDGSALSERAVGHAEEISRGTGAEVILLQVVHSPLGSAPEAGQAEEEKAVREAAAQALSYLNRISESLARNRVNVRCEVLEGAADAAILGLAHDENVDVIVMSTHGRSGLSKVLMGSVAEKVVLTTKRPVMLVKPERSYTRRIEEADAFISAR